ncbi:FtsW/RodA/SpoVE family cell cycle protein [Paracoccaceae bacterium GXU_MW_L88]
MTDMVYGGAAAHEGEPILPRWWHSVDRVSLACVLGLIVLGILLTMAASPPLAERNGQAQFSYVIKQLIFAGPAIFVLLATSMCEPTKIRRIGVVGFLLFFVAIVLLPVFGTDYGKGATRWYSLGFGSLQPSEFIKPCYAVTAGWLMAAGKEIGGPPGGKLAASLGAVLCLMLALQPDFGQAGLIFVAWVVMYFISGAPLMWLILAGVSVAALMRFAYSASEHVARRIDGFLSADVDPRTQIGYAMDAIKEGGFLGVGLGEGEVKWRLPDAHTDFIIAVGAEEYGMIIVLLVIALYMTITIRALMRLSQERDLFIRLAGSGLAALFATQAMINLGVAVRLLPAKGMTLPFISYGGSSLVAASLSMGMLLALTRTRPQHELSEILGGQ